jgi:hypothetical protein
MTDPAKGKNTLLLQIAGILVVVAGLGTALYLPKLLQDAPPLSRSLPTAPGCDLNNSSCLAQDNSQSISLSIDTDSIHSAKALPFIVTLADIKAEQVMVDLQGKEMFMGLNQVMMKPVPGTDNQWQADVTLAVCTTGTMTWVATIKTEANGIITDAAFEFDAQ